jgi:hypothetical protein
MASKDPPESYKKNQKVREPAWARLPGCLFVPPRTERRRANDSEPPSEHGVTALPCVDRRCTL